MFYGKDYIQYYINGTLFYEIKKSDFKDGTLVDFVPLWLRLGVGGWVTDNKDTEACKICEATMEIDYVKAYRKKADPFLKWVSKPSVLKWDNTDTGLSFRVSYLPTIAYTWDAPDFTIAGPFWFQEGETKFLTLKLGKAKNQFYPVSVTATYPDGTSEIITTSVFVYDTPYQTNVVVPDLNVNVQGNTVVATASGIVLNTLCPTDEVGHYQWSWDNQNWFNTAVGQNGITSNNTPEGSGTLFCRMVNCFGTSAATSVSFFVDVIPLTQKNNPKELVLNLSTLVQEEYDVKIFDMLGRLLKRYKTTDATDYYYKCECQGTFIANIQSKSFQKNIKFVKL